MNDSLRDNAVPWRRVALIVATAFVVKLVVLMQLWNHPLLQPHGELDTAYYIALGRRIALEGVLAPIGAFFVSPLYVYFLAAVFAAGGSLLAAQLIQIGLGAAAVGMLFATARHWFGERAALVAAGLAMLTGIFTFNEVLILQSALDPFLVSCSLYALTRTIGGRRELGMRGRWRVSGFAGAQPTERNGVRSGRGCRCVRDPVAAHGGGSIQRGPRRWWARVNRGTVLVASLLIVLAANAARNYAVSGDVVLIASHGGLNLYIGNHDRADGTYTPVPGVTPSIAGQAGDSTRVAESSVGRRLSPGRSPTISRAGPSTGSLEHPGDALRLTIRKIGILLNRVDVPLNYSYAFYAREPSSFLRVLAVGPWLLLPFGLVGLFWPALRANRFGYWVWAMFVPVYGAAVVLFFVTDRYRMPLFVPLCATAGAALLRFFDLVRARRFVPLLLPAGAVSVVALVAFANLGLDNGIGGEQTRKAVWLVEQGSFDEARRYVEQIANEHSHPGVLRFRVAQALLDAGRHADAAPLLAAAITIDGPRPAIRLALGEAVVPTEPWTGPWTKRAINVAAACRANVETTPSGAAAGSIVRPATEESRSTSGRWRSSQCSGRSDPMVPHGGCSSTRSGRGAREAGRRDFPAGRSSHRSSASRARPQPRAGERQRSPQPGRALRRTREVYRGADHGHRSASARPAEPRAAALLKALPK